MKSEDNKYALSICIPVYNRLNCLRYTFDRLIKQLKELDSHEVEVVVSVNPCEDVLEETKNYLYEKQRDYDFTIHINETNIGSSGNITKAINLAHGRMVWVIGDDDQILSGCVSRVLKILKTYPDVSWIFLACARLNGFPDDRNAVVTRIDNYQLVGGYHKNGKDTAVAVHNKIGGDMLFSSVNLFLKSKYEEISAHAKDIGPQLGAAFASAVEGAVYLDNEVGILAGGCISWKNEADYSITTRYFQDMYSVIGHGFTKQEVDGMIGYYMRHEGLHVWFRIYRLCLQGNQYGKESFRFFYGILPVQTVVTLFLSPAIAFYLCLRHQLRNIKRKKSCSNYIKSQNSDDLVVSRIKG